MKIIVNKKIANDTMQFEVEDRDEKEAISKALFFVPNEYCNLCKGVRILWGSNKANTTDGVFTYIKRKCMSCGAVSTAGSYKTGGLYWKPFEVYKKPETNANGTMKPQTTAEAYRNGKKPPMQAGDRGYEYPESDIPPEDIPF